MKKFIQFLIVASMLVACDPGPPIFRINDRVVIDPECLHYSIRYLCQHTGFVSDVFMYSGWRYEIRLQCNDKIGYVDVFVGQKCLSKPN